MTVKYPHDETMIAELELIRKGSVPKPEQKPCKISFCKTDKPNLSSTPGVIRITDAGGTAPVVLLASPVEIDQMIMGLQALRASL